MLKSNTPTVSPLKPVEVPPVEWGAAAVATVGSVTVEVDRELEISEWELSLDMPAVYLRLPIDGPEFVARLHDFLTAQLTRQALDEFPLGHHSSQAVTLVRDMEPGNRCFIVIGADEKSSVRLTVSGDEVRHWAKALEDVSEQLCG